MLAPLAWPSLSRLQKKGKDILTQLRTHLGILFSLNPVPGFIETVIESTTAEYDLLMSRRSSIVMHMNGEPIGTEIAGGFAAANVLIIVHKAKSLSAELIGDQHLGMYSCDKGLLFDQCFAERVRTGRQIELNQVLKGT